MINDLPLLRNSKFFQGLNDGEIRGVCICLGPMYKQYKKEEFIVNAGDPVNYVGLLIKGAAMVIQEDPYGRRLIIEEITPGQTFAETTACLPNAISETGVIAQEDCKIMFFDVTKIITMCPSACAYHTKVIRNLLTILAEKNTRLTHKVNFLAKRTIRERLLAYLSSESSTQGTTSFTIPYNRQQLADYLSVDRSALSTEIGKLQKEGIIACQGNKFQLIIISN